MREVVQLSILQFSAVYLLLLVILAIMRHAKINQTKLLLVASCRMTVQLVLAGLILTYIFENPHPAFTVLYLLAMVCFAVKRTLAKNPGLNHAFKLAVAASLALTGLTILAFFVLGIVGQSFFNPQYTIPLAGMIIGNAMTGVTLALKAFNDGLQSQRPKLDALLNLGATPKKILLPHVNNALETALLPTMNNMLGMGIISLPGMMTGQILSGTLPMTAIMYQIAIMIAICATVCLASFCALHFGYRTLVNSRNQITL
ncbi:MAG: iron export ABC transporter permease subunit FetB [Acidaminococcaceae bacterium]